MKQNVLMRIGQVFFYALMAVCVVLIVIFYLNTGNINPDDPKIKQMSDLGPILNYLLVWAYILVGIAIVFSIGFPLFNMASNPKKGLKTLISVVLLAVVFFVAYQLGDDTILQIAGYNGKDNVASTLKLTDMGIYAMYALIAGSILAVLYSSISKLFK